MKSSILSNLRPLLRALCPFFLAIAVLWVMPRNAQAQRLYITQMPFFPLSPVGEVSEYDPNTGGLIKEDFIRALNNPSGLTVSGNTLFVSNFGADFVGKFDADTGAAINPAFITGVPQPVGLAVLGNTLFVVRTRARQGDVGKYDATTGAAINKDFLTKLDGPEGLAASDNALFVALQIPDYVAKYDATTSATIFVIKAGLRAPVGLALSDNTLFVANLYAGVGKYDATTGKVIDANFITGPLAPRGLRCWATPSSFWTST